MTQEEIDILLEDIRSQSDCVVEHTRHHLWHIYSTSESSVTLWKKVTMDFQLECAEKEIICAHCETCINEKWLRQKWVLYTVTDL